MTTFLSNRAIYENVIRDAVPQTRERLWIATADIKDMYVDSGGRDMVPFLAVLDGLLKRGVEIRLIGLKVFRTGFTRFTGFVSHRGAESFDRKDRKELSVHFAVPQMWRRVVAP